MIVCGGKAAGLGGAKVDGIDFDDLLAKGAAQFTPDRVSQAEDPLLLMYTSGTTGNPKGVLHAHRYVLGHNGIDYSYNFLRDGDLYYSPADWAWAGGLLDGLLAIWPYGIPVLAYRSKARFDPDVTLRLLEKYGASVGLYPPTALKTLREVKKPREKYKNLRLRCVVSGAEPVPPELARWVDEELKVEFNQGFGQTEANYFIGTCGALEPYTLEALGKAYPGHRVQVVDAQGQPVAHGEVGEIAIGRESPGRDARVLEESGSDAGEVQRRVVRDRRHGLRRRRWLLLLSGPRRRRHQDVGLPRRSRRDRSEDHRGEGCRIVRRDRCVRREARSGDQGVHQGDARHRKIRRADPRDPGAREAETRGARISARDRVHRRIPDDGDGQGAPSRSARRGGEEARGVDELSCMQDIQLVALDIDGTLIAPGAGHEALPDADITDAIARLVDAGVAVVLASGRMYPGTARIAHHLGLTSPLICQQGASVHRLDGSLMHRYAIDADIAEQLVAYALEHDWPYAWFDAVRYLVSRPNDACAFYGRVSGVIPEYRVDAHRAGVIPTGIDIISTAERANGVHQELDARYGDRINLLDFPSVTAAHAREASKGNALALLAQDLGIEPHAVLAIGDSVNDASMLRWAGRGVAMPHSDRYARDAADEVLGGTGVAELAPLLRSVLAV